MSRAKRIACGASVLAVGLVMLVMASSCEPLIFAYFVYSVGLAAIAIGSCELFAVWHDWPQKGRPAGVTRTTSPNHPSLFTPLYDHASEACPCCEFGTVIEFDDDRLCTSCRASWSAVG